VTTFSLDLGPMAPAFDEACRHLRDASAVTRLWGADPTLWSHNAATERQIRDRLGWLQALDFIEPTLPRLRRLADEVRRNGLGRVLLLGMGGSSLAPEVFRRVVGVADGFPRFQMLDSVAPDAVRAALAGDVPTLFIVASKSGTTIEVTTLAAEAERAATQRGAWGPQVVAITDPETALARGATTFRDAFLNPPTIGGRYSALSFFGMVPAALMGADLDVLVRSGRAMETACRLGDVTRNPGFALGAFMAASARTNRDKLTLLLPPELDGFGLWVEQLVAESTGKRGRGIVPIVSEAPTARLGSDRACIVVRVGGRPVARDIMERLRDAAAPTMTLDMAGPAGLAGEFLRWEVATAVVSHLLGVNPFDEPDVAAAKQATRDLLEALARDGALPEPSPDAQRDGCTLSLSRALSRDDPWGSLARSAQPGNYVAVLAYAPPDDTAFAQAIERGRTRLGQVTGVATSSGFGPRYLHSTGQLHKGGPDTGLFVVVVSDHAGPEDPIPGAAYTLGQLERAQAIGDFRSLEARGRRAVYLRLPRRDAPLLDRAFDALAGG
jgi:glucose-6-phosphate isomerase